MKFLSTILLLVGTSVAFPVDQPMISSNFVDALPVGLSYSNTKSNLTKRDAGYLTHYETVAVSGTDGSTTYLAISGKRVEYDIAIGCVNLPDSMLGIVSATFVRTWKRVQAWSAKDCQGDYSTGMIPDGSDTTIIDWSHNFDNRMVSFAVFLD